MRTPILLPFAPLVMYSLMRYVHNYYDAAPPFSPMVFSDLHCVFLQAVERLNLKPRHFHDLITDEPFTRADIITLQDPMAPERFDVTSFYHVKNKLSAKEGKSNGLSYSFEKNAALYLEEGSGDGNKATRFIRQLNPETRATLEALSKEYKEPTSSTVRIIIIYAIDVTNCMCMAGNVYMASLAECPLLSVMCD